MHASPEADVPPYVVGRGVPRQRLTGDRKSHYHRRPIEEDVDEVRRGHRREGVCRARFSHAMPAADSAATTVMARSARGSNRGRRIVRRLGLWQSEGGRGEENVARCRPGAEDAFGGWPYVAGVSGDLLCAGRCQGHRKVPAVGHSALERVNTPARTMGCARRSRQTAGPPGNISPSLAACLSRSLTGGGARAPAPCTDPGPSSAPRPIADRPARCAAAGRGGRGTTRRGHAEGRLLGLNRPPRPNARASGESLGGRMPRRRRRRNQHRRRRTHWREPAWPVAPDASAARSGIGGRGSAGGC